jgi:hypothetical protein
MIVSLWRVHVALALSCLTGCGGGHEPTTGVTSPVSVAADASTPPASRRAAPSTTTSGPPATMASGPPSTSASAAPPTSPAPSRGPLGSVSWIVGSWAGTGPGGARVEETWVQDGEGLKGEGRTVSADGEERRESMRIEARDGGALVLVARPDPAAPPTEFTLDPRTSGPAHAQFVNEGHDWPTRIRYERVGDELTIRVRGRPGQADESSTLRRR